MKFTVLGSGTPRPTADRVCSSYLIEVGGDRILFDHGFGAGQRLLQLGVDPRSVSHVFLSHHHYDHIGDMPRLMLTRWDQQRDVDFAELEVFGPPPVRAIVDRMIGRESAFATDIAARLGSRCSRDLYVARGGAGDRSWPSPVVTELRADHRVDREKWSVRTATAIHCPGDLECLAYRIDAGAGSIVYTGDTGPSEPIVRLAEGCDVLIHMCSQVSGEIATPAIEESSIGHREVAEAAARAGAKKLVLTHIQHLDDAGTRCRTLEDIARIYDGEVVVAEDLMAFEVSAG